MNKYVKTFLILSAFMCIVTYLIGSFFFASFDISAWTHSGRGITSLCFAASFIVAFCIVMAASDAENQSRT